MVLQDCICVSLCVVGSLFGQMFSCDHQRCCCIIIFVIVLITLACINFCNFLIIYDTHDVHAVLEMVTLFLPGTF